MTGGTSSIGFLGVFGRSGDLRQLDQAFRALDIHPRMVPEPIKLTIAKLLKEDTGGEPAEEAYRAAAALVGYCILGPQSFAGANSEQAALAIEARIDAALSAGDGLDARLVLLAIHAGIIEASVVDLFDLASD